MRFKKGHFMTIPSAVFFSDLTPREKLTLLTICSFASPKDDYTVSLTNSVFVKATSMDERTVKKALIELQDKELIDINYPNEYTRTITLNAENLIDYFDIQVEDEEEKTPDTSEDKRKEYTIEITIKEK